MKRERKTEDIVNAISICTADMEATRKTILNKANLVIERLEQDKIQVDTSELKKAIEQGAKLLEFKANQVNEKRDKLLFYWRNMAFCGAFCVIGLAALFFAYKFGFESKQEYRKELEQDFFIISKEKNPNFAPFMKSNAIIDLYQSFNNGEISQELLQGTFKYKKTPQKKAEKTFFEEFWNVFTE